MRRCSQYGQSPVGNSGMTTPTLSTDDLESVFSDDTSSLQNARIGFCDTPDQTLDRKLCEYYTYILD